MLSDSYRVGFAAKVFGCSAKTMTKLTTNGTVPSFTIDGVVGRRVTVDGLRAYIATLTPAQAGVLGARLDALVAAEAATAAARTARRKVRQVTSARLRAAKARAAAAKAKPVAPAATRARKAARP